MITLCFLCEIFVPHGDTVCIVHIYRTFGETCFFRLTVCRLWGKIYSNLPPLPSPAISSVTTLTLTKAGNNEAGRLYRCSDKSLARPGRKQTRKYVRDARDLNNIETRAVIKIFFLQGKALKEIHAILTEILACSLPGRTKDLSASL